MTRQGALRPADLAREHGLSAQAVRNYEEAGILPPADRGPQGYRQYSPLHAQALRAFLALRAGFGHQVSAEILRAANAHDDETAFRLIDQGHADLLRDRTTLDEVAAALGELTSAELTPTTDTAPLTIGALAHRLDVHPATLRKWENAGILHPTRDPATGYRLYPPDTVRDAHLAHQLRRGGYLLEHIAPVITHVRDAGGIAPLEEALHTWRTRLHHRSRAMLNASAHLAHYLDLRPPPPTTSDLLC
ncbi:TioE family transcriptional regulator [Streptoalloteichus hindustanus]|uniref:DNA-binding transcriptional regulator, MerR family n=1 Tax=Streptoalloteichus hindustanus TaxID=2017 RepID=A0A1M5MFL7_STRHI|nr:DNA-binding transcriptional regulator, MerR family [Streptoalloteichus hindustanus]